MQILFFCVLAVLAVSNAFPPPKTCQISDSDPKPDWNSIQKSAINLDLAPTDRWAALASEYKVEIATMVNEFVGHLMKMPGDRWEVKIACF